MMDGLGEIDWAGMRHALGPANDVPDRIAALASIDSRQRRWGLDGLWTTVRHQGGICEVTAPALPFLVDLAMGESLDRKEQAELLYFIVSSGSAALRDPSRPDAAAVVDELARLLPRLCDTAIDDNDAVIACVALAAGVVNGFCQGLLERVQAARSRASTPRLIALFDIERTLLAGDDVSDQLLDAVAAATPDGFGFYRTEGDFSGVSNHQQAIEAVDLILELGGAIELSTQPR